MGRRRDKKGEREIARERVTRLVELAEKALVGGRADRAARYGELAWRVKTTYQLRGTAIDGRRCRACGAFFGAGNSRVRIREGVRIVTCLACGAVRRRALGGRLADRRDISVSPTARGDEGNRKDQDRPGAR